MIVTTSRNANVSQKRFCKYLAESIPEIKHVPRGETSLKKFFEKASYFGDNFLLIIEKKKENTKFVIYKRKQSNFFPDKSFLLGDIFYKKPKEKITGIKTKGKFFYFLEDIDNDAETKAIQDGNQIKFMQGKEILFSFKIQDEENYD